MLCSRVARVRVTAAFVAVDGVVWCGVVWVCVFVFVFVFVRKARERAWTSEFDTTGQRPRCVLVGARTSAAVLDSTSGKPLPTYMSFWYTSMYDVASMQCDAKSSLVVSLVFMSDLVV